VKGCLRWLEHGLKIPARIHEATQQYRTDMDHLKEFFDDECVLGADEMAIAHALWQQYELWAERNGVKELVDRKQMAERLRALGCTTDRSYLCGTRKRIWRGIALNYKIENDPKSGVSQPQRDSGTRGTPVSH